MPASAWTLSDHAASGDENCVVGLAVDTTTQFIQIPAPDGDSGEKLKPGPVLFCMTMEGNLSLFSLARMENNEKYAEVVNAVSELPEASEALLNYGSDCKVSGETALAIDSPEHKRDSSVSKMVEKSGSGLDLHGGKASANESGLGKSVFTMPRVEPSHSQQLKKHPTTVREDADAKEQESLKESKREEVQAGHREFQSQRQVQGPVEAYNMPVSSTFTKTSSTTAPTTVIDHADAKKQDSLKEAKREEVQAGHREFHSQRQVEGPVKVYNRPVSSTFTKTSNTTALSEVELEVFRELNKVKGMAMEIESMMNFIEGKQSLNKGEVEPAFTKTSVEQIECKARAMYKQCESFREHLVNLRQSIIDLQDESLQVDAWRVYLQSILEQAFDVRYKELWIKQTLHPELAGMRKRILQADQSLKQHIAELEEHLHNLELYQWKKMRPPKFPLTLSARCVFWDVSSGLLKTLCVSQ
ncbi:hypothetical protein L7F22_054781 [Adiantum nelumboides]|nr:hypothetical protein [Adiantum nelumboides]